MAMKRGYKETELGFVPQDWDVKPLGNVFSLKHGYAFSSDYFSKSGPIVLTPGNFRLEGGLYFEERNTKRYSGKYSPDMTFRKGDLLIVMTDLTPDCNLLGKPAFIENDETVLHNQRIGRVQLKDKTADLRLLFYLLLSRHYLDMLKERATGSTVRHTSNKSIYAVQVAWPQPPEQRAIAEALSDVDGLLGVLDRLVAKKRDLKQAAMQQLLTGQTRLPGFHDEWVTKPLGNLLMVRHGKSQRGIVVRDGNFPILASGGEIGRTDTSLYDKPSVLIGRKGTIDSPQYVDVPFWTVDTLFFTEIADDAHPKFIFYKFTMIRWRSYNEASGVPSLNAKTIEKIEVEVPATLAEQTAIAEVLTEMDAELAALEQRREKTHALKQAMMQELLTGRIRLVKPEQLEVTA
jgi:type I restriction enzyme S subunit